MRPQREVSPHLLPWQLGTQVETRKATLSSRDYTGVATGGLGSSPAFLLGVCPGKSLSLSFQLHRGGQTQDGVRSFRGGS